MASADRPRSSWFRAIVQKTLTNNSIVSQVRQMEFTFSTVVHKNMGVRFGVRSACECAFLHEYFDYLEDRNAIQETEFNKLCSWIDNNECPHVALATESRHEIVSTSVTALQVAIACDNLAMCSLLISPDAICSVSTSSMYNMNAIHTAVLKNKFAKFEAICSSVCRFRFGKALHSIIGKALSESFYVIEKVDQTSEESYKLCLLGAFQLSAKRNDVNTIKTVLKQKYPIGFTPLSEATHLSIKAGDEVVFQELIESYPYKLGAVLTSASVAAATGKGSLLKHLKKIDELVSDEQAARKSVQRHLDCTLQLSMQLKHESCTAILQQYASVSKTNSLDLEACAFELRRILKYVDAELFCNQLHTLYESGYDVNNKNSCGHTLLLELVHELNTQEETIVFDKLIELGADVNETKQDGDTALWTVLSATVSKSKADYRPILKCILYHNPRPKMSSRKSLQLYTLKALEFDRDTFNTKHTYSHQIVKFQLDTPNISLYDLAFPLLWECGFPVMQCVRNDASHKSTPEILQRFIQQVMSEPRCLQMLCRDKLRVMFPGRQLHQFLQMTNQPKPIADYILISHLLRNN